MNMQRVLIIAAHPDDEVLGCGATIHKLIQQNVAVKVLILGEGSSCRYPLTEIESTHVQQAIKLRRDCASKALKVLSVEQVQFVNYPCGRFDTIPLIDIGKTIEACITDFKPDTVFTHSLCDTNNDHKLSFQATLQATRPTPGHCVQKLLSYEVLSSSEWNFGHAFTPNYFIDISKHLQAKLDAFNCYARTEGGEYPYPRSEQGLTVLAQRRGMQAGLNYAEAFTIIREIQE